MPRRRKNRKIKNTSTERRIHQRNSDENVENTLDTLVNDDTVRNYNGNVSLNSSHFTALNLLRHNTSTPSPKLYQRLGHVEAIDSLDTTPVNKNRSQHRDRKNSSRKLCITNLNVLFDSEYVRNASYDSNDSDPYRNRMSVSTHDSIIEIKESRSNVEKKSSRDLTYSSVGIQTTNSASQRFSHQIQRQNAITETPRKSNFIELEELTNEAFPEASPCYNLNNCNKPSTATNHLNLSNARVNLNPYLQNNDLRGVLQAVQQEEVTNEIQQIGPHNDASAGELSFFTPHLFERKLASTPIENVRQNIEHILKDTSFQESPNNVANNVEVEKTIKSPTTLYFSCSSANIQKETNLAREVFSKSLTTQTSEPYLLGRRSLTPKVMRYVNHTRSCSRSHSFVCQRMHRAMSPRKFPICISETGKEDNEGGACEMIFTRLKKYSRMSAKWSMRVLEICAQLGVTLKRSLSTICQLYSLDKSLLEESANGKLPGCKCEEYRSEIDRLNSTLKSLTDDLFSVKSLMLEQKENAENVLLMNEELLKMKNEMRNFAELKKELDLLKEQIGKVTVHQHLPMVQMAPAPPPPPPPLPPPLPPPANPAPSRQSRTLPRRRDKKGSEDMRPIISLDDILKVKLKKTSERASPLRRSTQPVVSTEMLKQVRLRPASRPQTPISTNDASSSCSSVATSPHSSLTRLLNSDSSVCRVKRLKRLSGYSFDDFSRRSQLAKKDRDRERIAD